jgi:hypothetical protein
VFVEARCGLLPPLPPLPPGELVTVAVGVTVAVLVGVLVGVRVDSPFCGGSGVDVGVADSVGVAVLVA